MNIPAFASRVSLALLFVVSGIQKIAMPGSVAKMFVGMGLPVQTAYLVGAFELGAGIAFIAAFRLRWIAAAMAVWCIVTALAGHRFWMDPTQIPNFLKNVGLAGAFFLFAAGLPTTADDRDAV